MANAAGRPADDRRRVRANRVVDTANTGKASKIRGFRISRSSEFRTGSGAAQTKKNGRV